MTSQERVVIVGAGIAGLTAARALGRHGVGSLLLEGAKMIGGRVRTQRLAGWALPIELGAEFVHGRPGPTLSLGGGAIELVPVAERRVMSGAQPRMMRETWQRFADALEPATREKASSSVADYLATHSLRPSHAALVRLLVEGYHGAPLHDVSARAIAQDAARAREEFRQYRTARGYDAVLSTLEHDLARRGARVELGARVRRVQWQRGRVEILADTSGSERLVVAERCLLTVSLGVLKQPASAGGIDVRPLPPAFTEALPLLGMGTALRVVLRFERAPWLASVDGVEPVFLHAQGAPFATFWREARAGQEQVTAWAGGPPAAELSRLSEGELVTTALQSLASASGESFVTCRRLLLGSHYHDFNADPLTRGAYSYVRPGGEAAARSLATPADDTLFFGGEALDLQYPGTVAGALGSGEHAARQILASLRQS